MVAGRMKVAGRWWQWGGGGDVVAERLRWRPGGGGVVTLCQWVASLVTAADVAMCLGRCLASFCAMVHGVDYIDTPPFCPRSFSFMVTA